MMTSDFVPLYRYWQPRYWPGWLVLAILRSLVALPQPVRMACGRWLGRRAHGLLNSRRRVARRNLELCFPERGADELDELTLRHFESLGMGVIELGMAWWCSDRELLDLVRIEGTEHVEQALEQGNGVIMLSGHFAITEIAGRAVCPLFPPMAAMYRPSDNPMNDQIMRRCRGRSTPDLISKTGVRQLIKVLKANRPVWYAADQAYEGKGAELVEFFGVPAMTNTAISQIVRVSRSPVVPLLPRRLENGSGYAMKYLPALDNFPGEDPAADALRIHHILEEHIREAPEQYYWVHRRFKGRPADLPNAYRNL
jgi:KDO2-lipid IV(A) lauroyltransferase